MPNSMTRSGNIKMNKTWFLLFRISRYRRRERYTESRWDNIVRAIGNTGYCNKSMDKRLLTLYQGVKKRFLGKQS